MADDNAFVSALARAITEKSQRENRQSQIVPATLVSYTSNPNTPGGFAEVHLPGDPETVSRQMPVVTARSLMVGDSVLVQYDPPDGAYVVAAVNEGIMDTVRVSRDCVGSPPASFLGGLAPTPVPFCVEEHRDGRAFSVLDNVDPDDTYLSVSAAGLYLVSASVTWVVAGAVTTAIGLVAFDARTTDPITGVANRIGVWQKNVNANYAVRETAVISQPFYLTPGAQVRVNIAHTVNVNGTGAAASSINTVGPGCIFSLSPIGGRFVLPTLLNS